VKWLKNWWANHAQKTLGIAEVLFGAAEYVDQNTLNIVGGFLGPKWGPIVSKAIQCTAGLAIAYRGFKAHGAIQRP
jgi:hypothetical protein